MVVQKQKRARMLFDTFYDYPLPIISNIADKIREIIQTIILYSWGHALNYAFVEYVSIKYYCTLLFKSYYTYQVMYMFLWYTLLIHHMHDEFMPITLWYSMMFYNLTISFKSYLLIPVGFPLEFKWFLSCDYYINSSSIYYF